VYSPSTKGKFEKKEKKERSRYQIVGTSKGEKKERNSNLSNTIQKERKVIEKGEKKKGKRYTFTVAPSPHKKKKKRGRKKENGVKQTLFTKKG